MEQKYRPPRIGGEPVPADYDGPLYYRTFVHNHHARGQSALSYRLKDQKLRESLTRWTTGGKVRSPNTEFFDENSDLRPEWRDRVLEARLLASSPKRWAEFSHYKSERCKAMIEASNPGQFDFIAIDIERPKQGDVLRVYSMFATRYSDWTTCIDGPATGILGKQTIEISDKNERMKTNEWKEEGRFGYLRKSCVAGRDLFLDSIAGWVFSSRAIEELGDVISQTHLFAPLGIIDDTEN